MEAVYFSKMIMGFHQAKQDYISDDSTLHDHPYGNQPFAMA
jgi:hypothetical protein